MKEVKPVIFIVCGVHNALEETLFLIKLCKLQTYKKVKIIIVDDGSTDGTVGEIKKKYDDVLVLKGDGNLWWTGSLNKGVKKILKVAHQNDLILTINNDCTFDKDYLKKMFEVYQLTSQSIVGSVVLDKNHPDLIWDGGVLIDWQEGRIYEKYKAGSSYTRVKKTNNGLERELDALSTKGLLFPVELIKDIGLFDQKHFPHYLSDYEYTVRAKKRGWKLIMSYRAPIFNDIGRTGFDYSSDKKFSISKYQELLFGRRSRVNLIDQINFIKYCCPSELKLKNYFLLFKRILKAGVKVTYG